VSASAADELWERLVRGERAALARAITAAESSRDDHRALASELVRRAARSAAVQRAWRIGVTGPPGVGKSTLLDTLSARLIELGHRPAILAIDPSSRSSGGSLLGDQARMSQLLGNDGAFVRPSPTRGHLGGAAASTYETALLCAAAGYAPVLIETVGVGQSEVEVSYLADLTLLLLQPGAGDELQGIKRGVLEYADVVAVAQADGARRSLAEETRDRFEQALSLSRGGNAPNVLLVSSLEKSGIDELWQRMEAELAARVQAGTFTSQRRERDARSFRPRLLLELERVFLANSERQSALQSAEDALTTGELTLPEALEHVLAQWTLRG
jgi:LAO/AO transport system kinase